jgi:hypothetical protein
LLKNSLILNKPKGFGLAGRYRMVVRDAQTHNIVRETDWFDNLIVDAGLNRIGVSSVASIERAYIGTGTTTPAVGDTTLAAQSATSSVAAPATAASNSGSPDYITTTTYGYRFNAGTLNGNYTEVGVGWTSPSIFSRALILDGGGSPTTITVTSSQYLDVYYQIRIVPDLAVYTTSVVIGGVTYSVQRKPAGVGSVNAWRFANNGATLFVPVSTLTSYGLTVYSGTLGAVTGTPSGTQGSNSASGSVGVLDAYSSNSFERTGTISVGLNDDNIVGGGGFKSMILGSNYCVYQMEFDVNVPKTDTKIMSLSGKISWARL